MQKTAQERGFLSNLNEKLSPIQDVKKKLSPEFRQVMENLVERDEKARKLALDEYGVSLKQLAENAKTFCDKKDYMRAFSNIAQFHDIVVEIINEWSGVQDMMQESYHKYLLEDIDDETKEKLITFRDKFKPKAANYKTYGFTKNALFDELWEKIKHKMHKHQLNKEFEKAYKEFVNQTKIMSATVVNLQRSLSRTFKQLNGFRNNGKPQEYIKETLAFKKVFEKFSAQFNKYYMTHVKPIVDKLALDRSTILPEQVKPEQKKALPVAPAKQEIKPAELPQVPDLEVSRPTLPMADRSTLPMLQEKRTTMPGEPLPNAFVESKRPTIELSEDDPDVEIISEQKPKEAPKPPSEPQKKAEEEIKHDFSKEGQELYRKIIKINDKEHFEFYHKPSKNDAAKKVIVGQYMKLKNSLSNYNDDLIIKNSHKNFFSNLEKLSNESPILVAKFIYKYAQLIEKTDQKTSNKLKQIVNTMVK